MHGQAELFAAQGRAAFHQAGSHGDVPRQGSAHGCRHVSSAVGASSASAAATALLFCRLCCLGCSWLAGGSWGVVGEPGLGERAVGLLWRGLVACPSNKIMKEGKSAMSHCWAQRWWPQECCQLVHTCSTLCRCPLQQPMVGNFQSSRACFCFIQPIFSVFVIFAWPEFPFQTIPGKEIIYRGLLFPDSSLQVQFFKRLKIAL